MLCCGGPGGGRCLGGGFLHGDWLLERTGTRFHWVSPPMRALRAPVVEVLACRRTPGLYPLKPSRNTRHPVPTATSRRGGPVWLSEQARDCIENWGARARPWRAARPRRHGGPARGRATTSATPGESVGGLQPLDPGWKTLNKKAVSGARTDAARGVDRCNAPALPHGKRRDPGRSAPLFRQGRSRRRVRPGTGPAPAPGCRAAVRCR